MRDFVPVPNRLLTEAESSACISVFAAVASRRDRASGVAEIGATMIASLARVSKPTALAALDWLHRRGFLEVTRCAGHVQRRAYRFPDLDEDAPNRSKAEPVKEETGKAENRNRSKVEPEPVSTFTGTGQSGNHVPDIEKKQTERKPSARTAHAQPDPRHGSFRECLQDHWQAHNAIPLPWDESEKRTLRLLLRANPGLTAEAFRRCLANRALSEVNLAQRPREWLASITNFAAGPLDRFKQPKGDSIHGKNGNDGYRRQASKTAGNFTEAGEALRSLGYQEPDVDGDGATGIRHQGHILAVRQ